MNSARQTLYRTWSNMIARCYYPGGSGYKNYGGRGIQVCERWKNSFQAFVDDMGERPPKCSLDRIDVNGNYEPANCKWSTASEQARNRRASRYIEIDGARKHAAVVEEETGINMRTLVYRASQGWPKEKLLSKTPQWNNAESQKKAAAKNAELKRAQTQCKNGHELTSENVYLYQGRRACRACRRAWDRFLYYKRKRPFSDFL